MTFITEITSNVICKWCEWPRVHWLVISAGGLSTWQRDSVG